MRKAEKLEVAGTSSVSGSHRICGVCSTIAGSLWFVVREGEVQERRRPASSVWSPRSS